MNSTRWYHISVLFPEGFQTATDTKWFTFTQWKGERGGSPPIALEVKRDRLRLGGTRTNAGLVPGGGDLGPLRPGRWTDITVGMRLSPDPQSGWVEVWLDDQVALPRTAVATMDLVGGTVDPIYLKQGIYRDSQWQCTHVLYLADARISTP